MSDQRKDTGELSPIGRAGRKAGRHSREFVATMISLLTTALGVVAALAWNSALTKLFETYLGRGGQVAALFVYAIAITVVAVFAIIVLGRIATRIGTDPLEFKYPPADKED